MDTAGIVLRRMLKDGDASAYPFLDVPYHLLCHQDVGAVVVAAAIDDALAGLGGSRPAAVHYLAHTTDGTTMDETFFSVLAMSDVDPLVAVALAHAQTANMGMLAGIDMDLGQRMVALECRIGTAGPEVEMIYDLGSGIELRSSGRLIRFPERLNLPGVVDAAIVGGPLRRLISHRALDPLELTVEAIRSRDIAFSGFAGGIDVADMHAQWRHLADKGLTRRPAPPNAPRDVRIRTQLRHLLATAEEEILHLRAAVAATGLAH